MGDDFTPVSSPLGNQMPVYTPSEVEWKEVPEHTYLSSGVTYTPIEQSDFLTSLNANVSDITPYISSIQEYLSDFNSILRDIQNTPPASSVGDVNVTINYDSLVHVTGSADAATVRDLQNMATDMIDQAKTSLFNDLRKLGVVRNY